MKVKHLLTELKNYPENIDMISYTDNPEMRGELEGIIGLSKSDSEGKYILDDEDNTRGWADYVIRNASKTGITARIRLVTSGIKGMTVKQFTEKLSLLPGDAEVEINTRHFHSDNKQNDEEKIQLIRCGIIKKIFHDMMDHTDYESDVLVCTGRGEAEYLLISKESV